MKRSKKNRKRSRLMTTRTPASVTPRSGMKSSSRRRSANANDNADEHRQRHLEHAVAVPEPHVAGRERPSGHLDHEDGDRDDESRERRHGADDRQDSSQSPASTASTTAGRPLGRSEHSRIRGSRRARSRRAGSPTGSRGRTRGRETAGPGHEAGAGAGSLLLVRPALFDASSAW